MFAQKSPLAKPSTIRSRVCSSSSWSMASWKENILSFWIFPLKFFTWIPILQSSQVMLVCSGAAQVGAHIQSAWWEVEIDCELGYIYGVSQISLTLHFRLNFKDWIVFRPTSGFQYSGQSKVAMPAQNPGRFAFKQRVSFFIFALISNNDEFSQVVNVHLTSQSVGSSIEGQIPPTRISWWNIYNKFVNLFY